MLIGYEIKPITDKLAEVLITDNNMNLIYGVDDWMAPEVHLYSIENIDKFKAWAKENNVYVYCRPREDFYPLEAIKEAITAGANYIYMEDLS